MGYVRGALRSLPHVPHSPVVGVIPVKRLGKLNDLMRSRETRSGSDQTMTQLRLSVRGSVAFGEAGYFARASGILLH